ncbi:MAG TPA: hypothetical protein VG675_12300 [Bryobacteraceae bacterium]|nr:hypothetical protein [Bryobacteraceae bacterium]
MFELLEQRSSWGSFLLQQALSLIIGLLLLIVLMLCSAFIPGMTFVLSEVNKSDVAGFLLLVGISFSAGYQIQARWPSSYFAGRWVWVVPVAIWTSSFLTDLARGPFREVITWYFDSSYTDNERLTLVFGTIPMLSACSYATGLWVRFQRDRKCTSEKNRLHGSG